MLVTKGEFDNHFFIWRSKKIEKTKKFQWQDKFGRMPIFQDLPFLHQVGPKNNNRGCHFRHGVKPTSWCLIRPWFPVVTFVAGMNVVSVMTVLTSHKITLFVIFLYFEILNVQRICTNLYYKCLTYKLNVKFLWYKTGVRGNSFNRFFSFFLT